MLLHLGNDYMIPTKDVVMIADIESTSSEITEEFLDVADEEGFIKNYAKGEPKSFVITNETIYYSNISSRTLRKRMNFVNRLSRDV